MTFEISHVYNGINILEGLPFTKCVCNRTICAVNCYTWKGQNVCDTCYGKHTEEREQTRQVVEQHKPMKCGICSTVKIGRDHRFAYHPNYLFETTCIDTMINKGADAEDICKEVDRFDPLCIYCYDILIEFENTNGFTKQKTECTDKAVVQELYEAHNKEMYRLLHGLNYS
jgi:hypothetical protein